MFAGWLCFWKYNLRQSQIVRRARARHLPLVDVNLSNFFSCSSFGCSALSACFMVVVYDDICILVWMCFCPSGCGLGLRNAKTKWWSRLGTTPVSLWLVYKPHVYQCPCDRLACNLEGWDSWFRRAKKHDAIWVFVHVALFESYWWATNTRSHHRRWERGGNCDLTSFRCCEKHVHIHPWPPVSLYK